VLARIVAVLPAIVPLLTTGLQAQGAPARHGDMPLQVRSIGRLRLNQDNLASVSERVGPVSPWETGDAGDSRVWWCYRNSSDSILTILLASSSGEMGGPNHEVDQITLLRGPGADTLASHCATASLGRLSTPDGIRLGISKADALRLLGRPSRQTASMLRYEWEAEVPLATTDPNYRYWNGRRAECFDGRAPFVDVFSEAVLQFGANGAQRITIERNDESMC